MCTVTLWFGGWLVTRSAEECFEMTAEGVTTSETCVIILYEVGGRRWERHWRGEMSVAMRVGGVGRVPVAGVDWLSGVLK